MEIKSFLQKRIELTELSEKLFGCPKVTVDFSKMIVHFEAEFSRSQYMIQISDQACNWKLYDSHRYDYGGWTRFVKEGHFYEKEVLNYLEESWSTNELAEMVLSGFPNIQDHFKSLERQYSLLTNFHSIPDPVKTILLRVYKTYSTNN